MGRRVDAIDDRRRMDWGNSKVAPTKRACSSSVVVAECICFVLFSFCSIYYYNFFRYFKYFGTRWEYTSRRKKEE